jgi:hypothetical protein
MATHQPDWTTGKCLTCLRPWPCLTQQVLLEAHFLDARGALLAYLEAVCQDAGPDYRGQILGWLFE